MPTTHEIVKTEIEDLWAQSKNRDSLFIRPDRSEDVLSIMRYEYKLGKKIYKLAQVRTVTSIINVVLGLVIIGLVIWL